MADETRIIKETRERHRDLLAELAATVLRARSKGKDRVTDLRSRLGRDGKGGGDGKNENVSVNLGRSDARPWSPGDALTDVAQALLDASGALIKLHRRHADHVVDLLMGEGLDGPSGTAASRELKLHVVNGTSSPKIIHVENTAEDNCTFEFHVTPFEGRRRNAEDPDRHDRHVFACPDAVQFKQGDASVNKLTLIPDQEAAIEVSIQVPTPDKDSPNHPFKTGVRYRSEIHLKINSVFARAIPVVVVVGQT